MKTTRDTKKERLIIALVLCAAIAAGLISALTTCGGGSATAATVNGQAISEQAVTDRIMSIRNAQPEYADDTAWAQSLQQQGQTPSSLRERIISDFAHKLVTEQVAQERGITVDSTAVDEQLAQVKKNTGVDETAWQAALESYGYATEAELRDTLVISNLRTQLLASMQFEPTPEEFEEYALANISNYGITDGAAGGDIVFSDIDEDHLALLKEQWVLDNQDRKYQAYMDERFESASIVIFEMPKGLPYDVVL